MRKLLSIFFILIMLTCNAFTSDDFTTLIEDYSSPYEVSSGLKSKILSYTKDAKTVIIQVSFQSDKRHNFKHYHEAHEIGARIQALFDPEKTHTILKLDAVPNSSKAYKLTLILK